LLLAILTPLASQSLNENRKIEAIGADGPDFLYYVSVSNRFERGVIPFQEEFGWVV
jgi:hypothetical protein